MSHVLNSRPAKSRPPIGWKFYVGSLVLLGIAIITSTLLGMGYATSTPWAVPAAPFIVLAALYIAYLAIRDNGKQGIFPALVASVAFGVIIYTMLS